MSKLYLDKDDNSITKQEFLYGKDIYILPVSQGVIESRIEDLNIHLASLLEVDYRERETARINEILDEIKHWENLNNKE